MHLTAAYSAIPYALTQNSEAGRVLLRIGYHGRKSEQIFHRKAHTVHLLKNQYHENMEVKS